MKNKFSWLVVGAGPAGILALERLRMSSIPASEIAWVDPDFAVGDLGTKWRNVPSNTKVKYFTKFLEEFENKKISVLRATHELFSLEPEATCYLSHIADPLLTLSEDLQAQVNTFQTKVSKVVYDAEYQTVQLENGETIFAKNIILAQGAEPRISALIDKSEISLAIVLDPKKLAINCDADDVVAVFGSSHSAILALMNLVEATSVKKIINIYRSPLKHAEYLDTGDILHDNTGLKGLASDWAKKNVELQHPRIIRALANSEEAKILLSQCTKVIYAIGFDTRNIDVQNVDLNNFDPATGIIAPGLFGLGIAYPALKKDVSGEIAKNVGLWKFALHLQFCFPLWLKGGDPSLSFQRRLESG